MLIPARLHHSHVNEAVLPNGEATLKQFRRSVSLIIFHGEDDERP